MHEKNEDECLLGKIQMNKTHEWKKNMNTKKTQTRVLGVRVGEIWLCFS